MGGCPAVSIRPSIAKRWIISLISLICLLLCSASLTASAATEVRETKSALLQTNTEKVLAVLASSDICDSGCRYGGPHVVREVKLQYGATKHSYYKWTHVSQMKTVKFFKHYQISRGPITKVSFRTLTEEKDGELIKALEKETSLEHAPAFDAAWGSFAIQEKAGGTEVKAEATTRISGMMSVFAGAVRKETQKSLAVTFQNFER